MKKQQIIAGLYVLGICVGFSAAMSIPMFMNDGEPKTYETPTNKCECSCSNNCTGKKQ